MVLVVEMREVGVKEAAVEAEMAGVGETAGVVEFQPWK